MANMKELHAGVSILVKYEPEAYSLAAEHDQFWCGSTNPSAMTEDDLKIMEDSGWMWDDGMESWFIFT